MSREECSPSDGKLTGKKPKRTVTRTCSRLVREDLDDPFALGQFIMTGFSCAPPFEILESPFDGESEGSSNAPHYMVLKKNPITKPHFLSVSPSLSNSRSESQDVVWRVCQSFVVAFFSSSQCPLGFFFFFVNYRLVAPSCRFFFFFFSFGDWHPVIMLLSSPC